MNGLASSQTIMTVPVSTLITSNGLGVGEARMKLLRMRKERTKMRLDDAFIPGDIPLQRSTFLDA